MSNITKTLTNVLPLPIELVDHESSSDTGNVWCRSVTIGEYTVISGMNAQRFVCWTITIYTKKNGKFQIRKRYSDFVKLREQLVRKYSDHLIEIPKLPEKSVLLNFENEFLERRRNGLEFFFSSILLNPLFCNDEIVKRFLLS